MRLFNVLFFGLVILGLSACSKEETTERLPGFEVPVVRGFQMRNINGELMGSVGNPNIKLYDGVDLYSSKVFFSSYPNPTSSTLLIFVLDMDYPTTKKIWMVPAKYLGEPEKSALNQGMYTLYAGGTPLFQYEFIHENIGIDVSEFPEGYYRLYVKTKDVLLYDNIVISKQIIY
ncbi:MAG: hypothetical protein PHW35_06400 [Lentimicrobiaceae bacterium]|jgi:hypothetical protein|nr:hypothetical protein [Lentimicrobiaceae bacterium]MDD4597578.1 hypothetical protein [Lentimicrobiaceae bacterium]MDY0026608.1 hypothetical protein [Lentimicrobium sp.]HAH56682.1 hypothetical protein [Bacteroidales bacterium]